MSKTEHPPERINTPPNHREKRTAKDILNAEIKKSENEPTHPQGTNLEYEAKQRRKNTSADTEAAMVLMTEADFSDKAKIYIFAHLALSKGRSSYRYTNKDLFPLLKKYAPELLDTNFTNEKDRVKAARRIAEIVRPYAQAYEQSAAAARASFIAIKKSEQEGEPSEVINFYLLDYLDDIDAEAKRRPNYKNKSKSIRQDAARDYARRNLKSYVALRDRKLPPHMKHIQIMKQLAGLMRAAYETGRNSSNEDWQTAYDIDVMVESIKRERGVSPSESEVIENEDFTHLDTRDYPASDIPDVQKLDTLAFNSVSNSEHPFIDADTVEVKEPGAARAQVPYCSSSSTADAARWLSLCQSIGCDWFDMTLFDMSGSDASITQRRLSSKLRELAWSLTSEKTLKGGAIAFKSRMPGVVVEKHIADWLAFCEAKKLHLFCRPRHSSRWLIQLDDVSEDFINENWSHWFAVIATSPGKQQAWLCVEPDGDDNRRLAIRRHLIDLAKADSSASGSCRIPGSVNFKTKYEQPDGTYPGIVLLKQDAQAIFTVQQLEETGLLPLIEPTTKPEPVERSAHAPASHQTTARPEWFGKSARMPSYEKSLAQATKKGDGQPDRSEADRKFVLIYCDRFIQCGAPIDARAKREIADRLLQQSARAKEKGAAYVQELVDWSAKRVCSNQ